MRSPLARRFAATTSAAMSRPIARSRRSEAASCRAAGNDSSCPTTGAASTSLFAVSTAPKVIFRGRGGGRRRARRPNALAAGVDDRVQSGHAGGGDLPPHSAGFQLPDAEGGEALGHLGNNWVSRKGCYLV